MELLRQLISNLPERMHLGAYVLIVDRSNFLHVRV
jgi:hypothetical protein